MIKFMLLSCGNLVFPYLSLDFVKPSSFHILGCREAVLLSWCEVMKSTHTKEEERLKGL